MPNSVGITGMLGSAYGSLSNDIINSLNDTALPAAQNQLAVSQAVSPAYNELLTQLYQQYGPQLAAVGIDIGKMIQQGQVDSNAAVANSAGGQASLQAAIDADKKANPEFYATRAAEAKRLNDLMGSIDLSGQLSGSEQRAIDQSLAQQNMRTGTVNIPSASQTVANAMTYGEKTYQRQEQAKSDLASAIGQANSFMPASRSGVNGWNVMTGGGNQVNQAGQASQGLFGGTASGANPYANTLGSLMNNIIGAYSGVQNANTAAGSAADTALMGMGTGLGTATINLFGPPK